MLRLCICKKHVFGIEIVYFRPINVHTCFVTPVLLVRIITNKTVSSLLAVYFDQMFW
jgi:hypothetical protein